MGWNPFRSGPRADAGPQVGRAEPGTQPTDRLSMAIRQRRMFTAQQRVDQLPGFYKLGRRWCEPPTADGLDARLAGLAEDRAVQQWSEEALIEAARAGAVLVTGRTGFAHVRDEPEARWIEAPLSDLLAAAAAALGALRDGMVIFSDDGVLLIDVKVDGAGRRSYETAAQGDWPFPSP